MSSRRAARHTDCTRAAASVEEVQRVAVTPHLPAIASQVPWLTRPAARVEARMEQTAEERRSPERQRFVVQLLRRVAVLALVLAALVWAVPRLLVSRGVLGPDAAETILVASSALQTARAYGAPDGAPEMVKAREDLALARARLAAEQPLEARAAAERATGHAIAAQRAALVARSGTAERARAVYDDLDREVVELERLYGEATKDLGPSETSRLFSLMKATRVATGAVFLAYEEQDYERALGAEARAREAVAEAREQLESAKAR
jgi:hypothetical protein